jgi:hypothetical protein
VDSLYKQPELDILKTVQDTFKSEEVKAESSSNSSMDHYFPNLISPQMTKYTFKLLSSTNF